MRLDRSVAAVTGDRFRLENGLAVLIYGICDGKRPSRMTPQALMIRGCNRLRTAPLARRVRCAADSGASRSGFRDDADHDSGMKPISVPTRCRSLIGHFRNGDRDVGIGLRRPPATP